MTDPAPPPDPAPPTDPRRDRPPPPPPRTVTVPPWLAEDWPTALRLAIVGLAAMLALGVLATILLVLATVVSPFTDEVPWGEAAMMPGNLLLTHLGGVEEAGRPAPFVFTGYVVFALAVRSVARRGLPAAVVSGRARLLALAAKVGLVVAVFGLVLSIVLDVLGDDGSGGLGSTPLLPTASIEYDVAATFFLSLFASAVATALVGARTSGTGVRGLLGLGNVGMPMLVDSGLHGARHVLRVALPGMLGLWVLGGVLESVSRADDLGGSTIRVWFSYVLASIVVVAILLAVDWSILLLLGATTFVDSDGVGILWAIDVDVPAWAWASLVVLVGSLAYGGRMSAIHARPRTQLEAARAAVLVGPLVAAACLPVAIGWVGQGGRLEHVTTVAVLLPTVWGAVAVAAAWLHGVQQQLPSGVAIAQDPTPQAPEPPADENRPT